MIYLWRRYMTITNARFCNALLVCLLTMFAGRIMASNSLTVSVYDSLDMHPLSDAVVRAVPLQDASEGVTDVTNKRGQLTLAYTGPTVIHITHLGYQPVYDTIYDGRSRVYYIRSTASNMEDVVVTGQYTAGSARTSVYDVKVYTDKEFRAKGATNLKEALQGSLNVNLTQDAVFGSGISLQGISGQGVKIMVDAVPVVGRINGNLDVSQINLSNIQRVEIIKGPMSAIYGSDAMGGVINLISKTNQQEKYVVNLKGYYESVGQYNMELNGGINIKKSQFYIAGGRNFFGGYSAVDTSRHKDWLPKEQYFANAKYMYTSGRYRVGARLSFFRELMLNRGNLEPNTTYAYDDHSLVYRPQATVFGTIPIKGFSELNLMVSYTGFVRFYNYYKKDLVTLQESLLKTEQQDTSIYHDIVARGTYTLTTANQKVSFQFGTDISQEYTTQTLLAGGKHQMGDYAVFGSVRWRPVIGLDIQPALRFGYNTKFQSPLVPSVNLKYDFAKYFNIRAAYGMGYRAPSLYELYFDFHDSNHNLNGDSSLRAERGHSVNLSFSYQQLYNGKHHFKLTPSGFFNTIRNKIDFILVDASLYPLTYQYGNINSYMNAGAECTAEYAWQRLALTAAFDYIWYHAEVLQPVQSQVSFASPDIALQARYKIPKAEITVSAYYKYTGSKLNYSLTNSSETGTRSPFHGLDISLSRDFWKDRIQLTCGGKNLLNVTNVGNNGAIAFGHGSNGGSTLVNWGRTFFISLNLHFAK